MPDPSPSPPRNTLLRGDCLALLPTLPDASVNLVLVDLPYGTTHNAWDSVLPLDVLWAQYARLLAPGGAVVLTGQGVFTATLILSRPEWFRYKWVWQKSKPTNFLNARRQPLRAHEDVCVFYREQPPYTPQMRAGEPYDKGVRKAQHTGSYNVFEPVRVRSDGRRYPIDVVRFATAESEGPVWHATQKPVALGRYLVRTYTRPGDLVLDHAFGSGSFLVAALAEGRDFVGIELDEEVAFFKDTPDFDGERLDFTTIATRRLHAAWHALAPAARAGLTASPLLDRFAAEPPPLLLRRPARRRLRPDAAPGAAPGLPAEAPPDAADPQA